MNTAELNEKELLARKLRKLIKHDRNRRKWNAKKAQRFRDKERKFENEAT